MTQQPQVGDNKTIRSLHPDMYREMETGTQEFGPTSEGDGAKLIGEVRKAYSSPDTVVGHMPPVDGGALEAVDFLDKLGERLAFERTGTRLYDALLSKHDAFGTFDDGPSRKEIEEIRREEHEHFLMLEQVISQLGGDPAAVTPSADLVAVVSRGVQDALTDPRINLLQGLEAILVAELADNASWESLVELAQAAGHDALVRPFQRALTSEEEHLAKVKRWIKAGHVSG